MHSLLIRSVVGTLEDSVMRPTTSFPSFSKKNYPYCVVAVTVEVQPTNKAQKHGAQGGSVCHAMNTILLPAHRIVSHIMIILK
jgi:hypothetical protein